MTSITKMINDSHDSQRRFLKHSLQLTETSNWSTFPLFSWCCFRFLLHFYQSEGITYQSGQLQSREIALELLANENVERRGEDAFFSHLWDGDSRHDIPSGLSWERSMPWTWSSSMTEKKIWQETRDKMQDEMKRESLIHNASRRRGSIM